jgi:hypothetical protein
MPHLSPKLRAALLTAACFAVAAFPAAAQLEPPQAAPGQKVPDHAAGGWPTDTTGDDKKPARTPEQQAHLDSVSGELRRIANTHGPDSVVLQAKFLMRAMSAGPLGATEVRVGPSTGPSGPEHLEIDVETGLYFSGRTTTAESRRETVWNQVVLPVLDEMVSFKIEPVNLDLVLLFDVQDVAGPEALDPTAEARHEAFRVRLSREMLDDMAVDKLAGDAVRAKAELTEAVTVARPATPAPVP